MADREEPQETVRKVRELRDVHKMRPLDIAEGTSASVRQVYRWLAGSPPRTAALRNNVASLYKTVLDNVDVDVDGATVAA